MFLNLYNGENYCNENPQGLHKECVVGVKVTVAIKDQQPWPVFTIKLIDDPAVLKHKAECAHLHQDPELLQYMLVKNNNNTFYKSDIPFTVCADLNTPSTLLSKFYNLGYLYFTLRWTCMDGTGGDR